MVKIQGMKRIKRLQLTTLKRYLKKFPVVAVVGARQTGKTTLVRDLLKENRLYLTLDDPTNVMIAQEDPLSFVEQSGHITIDEIQKVPVLLSAIKQVVDRKKRAGQFLITGSANITSLPFISETLAGRIVFVQMSPFTVKELLSREQRGDVDFIDIVNIKSVKKCWEFLQQIKPRNFRLEKFILRGGLPPAYFESNDEIRTAWFEGYIKTYLERDIRDISRIGNLYEYQRFISLLAFRVAQILRKSEIARDSGIPYTTADRFFDLLLATYQIFYLQPYYRNIGKRLIKSPKIMWMDTGLAMYLQGLASWRDAVRLARDSYLVENKIGIELKTRLSNKFPSAKLFYWRTSAGAEIDFIIEYAGRIVPIEVKWKTIIKSRDILNMRIFLEDFKRDAPFGIILYKGRELLRLDKNIFLVPCEYLFSV